MTTITIQSQVGMWILPFRYEPDPLYDEAARICNVQPRFGFRGESRGNATHRIQPGPTVRPPTTLDPLPPSSEGSRRLRWEPIGIEPEPKGGSAMQMTVGATIGSRRRSMRPISARMRHFRLWLLMIGVLSLVAEAVATAAVFWRGTAPARQARP
jgi:hypothetical protein